MFPSHNTWQDASRAYQIAPEDLQALVQLASKYGPINLMFFLRSLGEPSRTSTVSQNTLSSNASGVPSLSWSTSEPSICQSETASIMSHNTQAGWSETPDLAPGFLPSDVPQLGDPAWSGSSAGASALRDSKASVDLPMSGPNLSVTSIVTASTPRKAIECTMCFVEGIVVGFSRKSDFKKHLQNFHHTNTVWVCQYAGCPLTFDFEKAYVAHVKSCHNDMHLPPNKARVETCAQLVFACGFKGCKDRVFEASSVEEAKALRDKYFDHVAKHFDMGFCVAEWEYYTQIQNLLRQEAVKDMWKQCVWQKSVRNNLRWQPRSSAELKRILECRHLYDIPPLLHYAWTLGGEPFKSNNLDAPELPPGIKRPLKRECPLGLTQHEALLKPASLKATFPVSQQSFQLSVPQPKPTPSQPVYVPDPRSSAQLPPKSAPHSLVRPVITDQDAWHAQQAANYPMSDMNQWHEGYPFGAQSTEHISPHTPTHTSAPEMIDHPMTTAPPPEQIQHHRQLQHQQHAPPAAHRPQYPQQHHPHQQHQFGHTTQPQQWPTSAPMEVFSPIDAPATFDQTVTPKSSKRSLSGAKKSLDSLRFKRREFSDVDIHSIPPVPTIQQPGNHDLAMRGTPMSTPTTYMHEVSMTG